MQEETARAIVGRWTLATMSGTPARRLNVNGGMQVLDDMSFSQWLNLNGGHAASSGTVRDEGGGAYVFVDPKDPVSPSGYAATLSSDGGYLSFPRTLMLGQATWSLD